MKAKLVFVDDLGDTLLALDARLIKPNPDQALVDAERVIDFLHNVEPLKGSEKVAIFEMMVADERARKFFVNRVEGMMSHG
jgi:hypothetical protein